MNSDKPLRITSAQYSDKPMVTLDINCRKLCSDLENLGFNTKDKRNKLPNIDNKYMADFMRGYFDGDGSLSLYEQKIGNSCIHRQELSLTGNPEFIKYVQNYLITKLNLSKTKLKFYKRTSKAVTLRFGKINDIKLLYDYLYNKPTRYLKTKHDKFIQFHKYHP